MAKYNSLDEAIKDLGLEKTIQQNISEGKECDQEEVINQILEWEAQRQAENQRSAAAGLEIQKRYRNVTESTEETYMETQEERPVTLAASLDTSSAIFGFGCFLIGILVTVAFFQVKIRRIKNDCEARLAESRSTLNKVLEITTSKPPQ